MTRVVVHPQAEAFMRALAPESRRRLVRAMKTLPRGDTKALDGRLSGFSRLREGGYRIIYSDSVKKGIRTFDCLFAERRPVVYEMFEQMPRKSFGIVTRSM